MSTEVQMYKCSGCNSQFDLDGSRRHKKMTKQLRNACHLAEILPVLCKPKTGLTITLKRSTSPHKPSSNKKVARGSPTPKKVSFRNQDAEASSSSTPVRSGSGVRKRGRPRLSDSPRKRPLSGADSTRNHHPLPMQPVFSLDCPIVRQSTPVAFLGRGSNTPEVEVNILPHNDPIPYEELRDQSPYTVRGMSPNCSLYPYDFQDA